MAGFPVSITCCSPGLSHSSQRFLPLGTGRMIPVRKWGETGRFGDRDTIGVGVGSRDFGHVGKAVLKTLKGFHVGEIGQVTRFHRRIP